MAEGPRKGKMKASPAAKTVKPVETKTKEPIPRSGSYRQYGYGRMYGV